MVKWKLQAVEPDTCDPPGCRYLEWWDAEADPDDRVHTVAAFDRVCPAHADTVPTTEMLGFDGNWKPKKEYIEYQRAWFRRLNHIEWLERFPEGDEPMPPQIAGFTSDPTTTGSVSPPPVAAREGMVRAYGRNRGDNQRKNLSLLLPVDPDLDPSQAEWSFTGTGDNRVLTIAWRALSPARRDQAQRIADIQFGPGKVIVQA